MAAVRKGWYCLDALNELNAVLLRIALRDLCEPTAGLGFGWECVCVAVRGFNSEGVW